MDFRRGHLLYFVTVAEEGQITRAAAKLHLAQPALSQAMVKLESELGVALLERHARGVTLTAAGEELLAKARTAISAWDDAVETARTVDGAREATVDFGFVGTPPGLDSPKDLDEFARSHPQIDFRYKELPFPSRRTAGWLAEVGVAVCHRPPADPTVWTEPLRHERRVVLAPGGHPFSDRGGLTVQEVSAETFIGLHPSVDPAWAGFWSLDDHRGRSPERSTPDRAVNAQEVLAALAVRRAITTVPAAVARIVLNVSSGLIAIPLLDAEPACIVLCGRNDRLTPQVAAIRTFARTRRARAARAVPSPREVEGKGPHTRSG